MRLTAFIALFVVAASTFALFSLRGDSEAAWPGQEGKIAFHNTGVNPGIYSVNFNGSGLAQLTTGADFYPSWSPNGQQIVFQRGAEVLPGGGSLPQGGGGTQIWKMDADGNNEQMVVGNGYQPSWSSDGTRIIFVQNADIVSTDVNGGDFEAITDIADALFYPVMSPNGAKIAFTREIPGVVGTGSGPAGPIFEYQLWTMDSNGANAMMIADVDAGLPFSSDWAPNGSNLIFYAGNMYTVVPGQAPVSMSLDESTPEPAYSPDGDPIVFAGYHPEGCPVNDIVYTIVYIPVGGNEGDITEIVGDPEECEDEYRHPDWQPSTGQPTPSPSPTPTVSPAPTPTASPTPGPTATASSAPTATATPTAIPTGSVTATVPPSGTAAPTPIIRDVVWGDDNCSDVPDPVDSLLTLRHDAGLSVNTGDCPPTGTDITVLQILPAGIPGPVADTWGNVDCDDSPIDPVDSLKILRFDAGLDSNQDEPCPPIGAGVKISYGP